MNKSLVSDKNLIAIRTLEVPETAKIPTRARKTKSSKIYVREQFGFFQKIRRRLNVFLMAIFVLLPLLQWNEQQAILFDVGQQKLRLFSITLFPQDLLIFALLFIFAAYGLFYITKLYGRVWCGYACPQTVWTLMFNWIERRIEGSHSQSKALDNGALSAKKITVKIVKHSLWIALSLLTAMVFMSYFVPAQQLYKSFFLAELSGLIFGWVMFFTACTYINGAWIKEKMCQHICPYSRFQSSMFDAQTKLVTYDAGRGESRGPRKRKSDKPETLGDCVDCNLCVQVCPVGIDIRDGLQYDCINCGLCVDACNETMSKFNYPKNLISYSSGENNQTQPATWRQHLLYGIPLSLTLMAMLAWINYRPDFEVNIIRDRHALYRVNNEGQIENTYLFKVLNKTQQQQEYYVSLNDAENALIKGHTSFIVEPESIANIPLSVAMLSPAAQKKMDILFRIENKRSGSSNDKQSMFYSGPGGW